MDDSISKRELGELLEGAGGGPCVSIFLPTVRAGSETQQNPVRFKNLLREATHRLEERDLGDRALDELLAPARALVDDYDFWQHQEEGLAVFLAPGFFRTYRVPLGFKELAAVEDRFHLKSLLPLFNVRGRFFILALSQKQVRLLTGDRNEVREVDLEDVPTSLAEALGHDLTRPSLQHHIVNAAAGAGANAGGGRSAIFHGQGGGEEDHKAEIHRFFQILDNELSGYLGDRREPLVLAGVDYLRAIYREVSDRPQTLDEGVSGNPDDLDAAQLHAAAWEIVEPHLATRRKAAAERFHELLGSGRSEQKLAEVVPATVDGRVDTLFVASGVRRWGRFDADERKVERHGEQTTESEDLLDFAAVHTYMNGGTVYAVEPDEVPGGKDLAAVMRY
jgi:hypothetical protein